jgi:hypothetical protein
VVGGCTKNKLKRERNRKNEKQTVKKRRGADVWVPQKFIENPLKVRCLAC